MRKHAAASATALLCMNLLWGQAPYADVRYGWRVETDIVYGEATDYAGLAQSLQMDIYKPVCDFNPSRPLFVLVHGGAFLEGNKNAGDIVALCRALASRGAVAASISYRLGMHAKGGNFDPGFFCIQSKCLYALDSTEFIRAAYRGVQDARGAIRFLKGRHALDSTDVANVFIGGSSAGGFVALYAGFLDQPSEKPAACFELPDAPAPSPLIPGSCTPPGALRARPDLGDIEGTLHLGNGYDASVRGVANFMGGMMGNILSGPQQPALYLYHQTDDLIVGCGYRRPFQLLFQYCGLAVAGCTPLYNTFPLVYGSCRIADWAAETGGGTLAVQTDIVNNGPPGYLSCLSGNNHSIVNIGQRVDNMMALFGPLIAESGNTGPGEGPFFDLAVSQQGNTLTVAEAGAGYQWIDCNTGEPIPGATGQSFTIMEDGDYAVVVTKGGCSATSACGLAVGAAEPGKPELAAAAFPNPGRGIFTLVLPWAAEALLYDTSGRLLRRGKFSPGSHQLAMSELPAGVYVLALRGQERTQALRLIRN